MKRWQRPKKLSMSLDGNPTFSPESLPTTLMSRPTAAASGASGISPAFMNCSRPGSKRMNPKSCTAGHGWFRGGEKGAMGTDGQSHMSAHPIVEDSNGMCRQRPKSFPPTGPRTRVVVQRLHGHFFSVQEDGFRHHGSCIQWAGRAMLMCQAALQCCSGTVSSVRVTKACSQSKKRKGSRPGVTTWRLVRISPRALSTTKPVA